MKTDEMMQCRSRSKNQSSRPFDHNDMKGTSPRSHVCEVLVDAFRYCRIKLQSLGGWPSLLLVLVFIGKCDAGSAKVWHVIRAGWSFPRIPEYLPISPSRYIGLLGRSLSNVWQVAKAAVAPFFGVK
jgi:hypothetical protein